MSFILFLFFVALLIWVIVIQQKLNKLTSSVNYLCRKMAELPGDKSDKEKFRKPDEEPIIHPQMEAKLPIQEIHNLPETPNETVQKPVYRDDKLSKTDSFELQSIFLGNIFNKIGALAIIVAAIIFAKLVSPFIVITPVMKIVLGYLAGMGMCCGALYLHRKEKFKIYSEVLLGTGFAVLFINTFCSYSLYHLFNTAAVLSIGTGLIILTYLLSDRMKTVSMLVIGLVGGYLTPCFSGAEQDTVLAFIVFLNIISLIFTLRNKHYNPVNIANLIITFMIFCGYQIAKPPLGLNLILSLWVAYIVYDLLRNKSNIVDNVVIWINYALLTFFTILLYGPEHTFLGCLFVFAAIVYTILSVISRKSNTVLYKHYDYCILLNIWLFVMFILNDISSIGVWSLVSIVLSLLMVKYKESHLKIGIFFFAFSAFTGALSASFDGKNCLMALYSPILNMRTLVFAAPVLSMIASSFVLKKGNEKHHELLSFGAVSLCYIYLIGEINSILTKIAAPALLMFNKYMIYTILGFIYSLNLKKLYITSKYMLFNVISFIFLPISILMLLFGSYNYPDGYMIIINMRFAAYAVAILSSLILAKWTKYDFYRYLAVFTGFFLVHSESAGISYLYGGLEYVISLMWVLYSGVVTICGILSKKRYLINSGIGIIILSILRIFIFDLAKVEALYKLIAFLALGIILMLVSYIYTANKNNK